MLHFVWNRYPILLMAGSLVLIGLSALLFHNALLGSLALIILAAALGIIAFTRQVWLDETANSRN